MFVKTDGKLRVTERVAPNKIKCKNIFNKKNWDGVRRSKILTSKIHKY